MVTTTEAKEYFGLQNNHSQYLKIRSEIRQLCQELDVFNQQSDRWDDVLVRAVDQLTFFSKRQTYRKAWNDRQATQEGIDFLNALKAFVGDAAANYGDKLRQNLEEDEEFGRLPFQWVTDCYHLTDDESSCVCFRLLDYVFRTFPNINWHSRRVKNKNAV